MAVARREPIVSAPARPRSYVCDCLSDAIFRLLCPFSVECRRLATYYSIASRERLRFFFHLVLPTDRELRTPRRRFRESVVSPSWVSFRTLSRAPADRRRDAGVRPATRRLEAVFTSPPAPPPPCLSEYRVASADEVRRRAHRSRPRPRSRSGRDDPDPRGRRTARRFGFVIFKVNRLRQTIDWSRSGDAFYRSERRLAVRRSPRPRPLPPSLSPAERQRDRRRPLAIPKRGDNLAPVDDPLARPKNTPWLPDDGSTIRFMFALPRRRFVLTRRRVRTQGYFLLGVFQNPVGALENQVQRDSVSLLYCENLSVLNRA